jgi:hypothetical protein
MLVFAFCSDTRELAFQQLQHTLATKDLELAKIQQEYDQLSVEITELRRVTRREGVNMDYLKNIIIQVARLWSIILTTFHPNN